MTSEAGAVFLPRRELRIVSLIGTGHFFSHFYYLAIPALFPLLRNDFGVSYTALGAATTAYAGAGGLAQIPMGFAVDRFGARNILLGGLVVCAFAVFSIGFAPSYAAFVVLMIALGLGDSVFHPADYAILNKMVDPSFMGRAFSVHTFAGHLGFAVAPILVISLAAGFGWRIALMACGAAGFAIAGVMFAHRGALRDRAGPTARDGPSGGETGLRLLLSPPLLIGLAFFVCIALTGIGISTFGVSTLHVMSGVDLAQAGVLVSAYLFAAPLGVLTGGWVADRINRHGWFAAACLGIVALSAVLIAAFSPPVAAMACLLAVAGFSSGAVAPSRDMLVRAMGPASESGKVFGFVTIGFNIGAMAGPLLYGMLLDHTHPASVFWAVGVFALLTVGVALRSGNHWRAKRGINRGEVGAVA